MLGRNGRTARGSATRDGFAEIGILILLIFVPVPITIGVPILVIRVWAPHSHGRTSGNESSVASPNVDKALGFLNPGSVRSVLASSTLRLAFRVRNLERSARAYRWTVTTHAPGQASTIVASGRLSLAESASQAIRLGIPISCTASRSRIDVSLGGANQTIGFWLPCRSQHAAPPASSTVLTFANPVKRATQYANGTVQFAVKIDNHTPSTQSYAWTVRTQTPGRPPVDQATGHLTLPTYYFAVVPERVRVVCTGARSRISVVVGSASTGAAQQTIGFFVPCPSGHT